MQLREGGSSLAPGCLIIRFHPTPTPVPSLAARAGVRPQVAAAQSDPPLTIGQGGHGALRDGGGALVAQVPPPTTTAAPVSGRRGVP